MEDVCFAACDWYIATDKTQPIVDDGAELHQASEDLLRADRADTTFIDDRIACYG